MLSLPDRTLWRALEDGDLVVARAAVRAGARPNWRAPGGERPLTAAVRWGKSAALVQTLIERGARVDFMNATSHTPLMIAAAAGRASAVRALLEAGAEVDRANRNQETALTYAVVWRQRKVAELLLGWGADVEHRQLRWSPLMYAANEGDPRAVALLLKHGADPHRRDRFDRTAYDIACQPRYRAMFVERAFTAGEREAMALLARAVAAPRRARGGRRSRATAR